MLKHFRLTLAIATVLYSCSSIKDYPKYQLSDGSYQFRQPESPYKPVFVYVQDDSISIVSDEKIVVKPNTKLDELFLKRSLDIDVMTVPFKYRTARATLPRQLTTDFNGNVFIGYRIDRFRVAHKDTPFGRTKIYKHRAMSMGGFVGLGSTAVTPWTTSNQTTDEYNGLILSRGMAIMIGVNNLTVGAGAGWDFLTDRDKKIWIYQNKPWYGLTVGLNLN